ncbi:MAG: hypothetical protein AAF235_05675 [Planctomycetota bacterium]
MKDRQPAASPDRRPAQYRVDVTVNNETDTDHGWRYSVGVRVHATPASTPDTEHIVTLSWADHDHLSGGATPPQTTVRAVVLVGAEHLGTDLPRRFDTANLRRLIDAFDDAVMRRLGT